MSRTRRTSTFIAVGTLLAAGTIVLSAPVAQAEPFGFRNLNPIQQRLVSGLLSSELNPNDPAAQTRAASPLSPVSVPQQPGPNGCPANRGGNIKVNVNCLNLSDSDLQGRGQSQNETYMAVDPNNPANVLASYNDYRRGDGTCGVSYSGDNGRTWADSTVPNNFVRGEPFGSAREYFQASGDTSVAFDTKGNAYLSCQMFDRGSATSPNPDQSSALYLYRSTGTHGASWNFPGRPTATFDDTAGAGNALLDKQFMTVDNHVGSPFQDRIYVSWTTFAADGTGYIYAAYSADYGESFSAPVIVSRDSAACGNTFGLPTPQGRCNENQFSQPFVGSDGALYVVYANFNNTVSGLDNRNQMLLARSTNGGRSFSAPVKVGDYYDLPDCQTYQGQNPGRACVPEKGGSANSFFRAANYPFGGVDPTDPSRVIVSYGSYINRNSNLRQGCVPTGFAATGQNTYLGVKGGGCNNDIVLSTSTDGGRTFTGGTVDPRSLPVATDAPGQANTDQFWQSAAFTPAGTFVVSYYDRQYGDDERTGYSDVTVSASAAGAQFIHTRATSSSMPPPTQFSGVFYGDYSGLAVTNAIAYPLWSDTRTVDEFACGSPPRVCAGTATNAPYANDQDAYTTGVPLP